MTALGRRVGVGVVFGVLVGVGLMVYSDASQLAQGIASFDLTALGPVLALSLVGYALRVAKWEVYLAALDVRLPRVDSALAFLAGMVMSITPGKVGEVLKSFLVRQRWGTPVATTAPIVVAERLTDFLALLVLAALGAASASGYGVGVLALAGGLTAALLAVVAWPPASRLALAVLGRMPVLSRVTPKLEEAHQAMLRLIGPRTLLWTTALSVVAWGCEAVGTWLILNAFPGVEATLAEATFVYAFATIAGALSMLPGGLLATEGSMIALLTKALALTDSRAVATAATLLVRFCTLWFGVALGLVALAAFRHRAAAHPSAPAESLQP